MAKCVTVLSLVFLLALPMSCLGAVVTVEALRGLDVRGSEGQKVGEVQSVLVDLEAGRVAYLLIAAGESGGEPVVIPWRAVKRSSGEKGIDLQADSARIKKAPFTQADLENRRAGEKIHRYYGVAPYWEEGESPKRPSAPKGLKVIR